MNRDLQRIWMQYIKDIKFDTVKGLYFFDGKFCNECPVYNVWYNDSIVKKFICRYNKGWIICLENENLKIITKSNNMYCPDVHCFDEFITSMTPRLKYFDFKECKNFVNYKNKQILRTIFLCLSSKLPSDCIFMILSFIRTIDLGNIL